MAGTTDSPTKITYDPKPTEEEVDFILREVKHYLSPGRHWCVGSAGISLGSHCTPSQLDIQVRKSDVLAAWAGIRPLVLNPNAENTAELVRNHLVHVSDGGLLTIAGGKWTTYRIMAEEAVDAAIKEFGMAFEV